MSPPGVDRHPGAFSEHPRATLWQGEKYAHIQPNEYTLTGGNISFTFVKSNFLGQPFAQYSDGVQTRDFFGSAVRVLETGIGTLVTVTTLMTIDTGGAEFSVLLPLIELAGITQTQSFSTDGIITRFKGPDSFPLTGVRESYEFIPMKGTARALEFVIPKFAVSKAG